MNAAAEAVLQRAVEAVGAGRIEEAAALLEEALVETPHSVRLNFELGNLRYQTLDLERALIHFQRAFEADPTFAPAATNLGAIYFARQDWAAAESVFQSMLGADPQNPKVHNNLGNVSFEQGRFDQALARYQRAVELDPAWWEPEHNRATALDALGRQQEALACHDRALALAPAEAEVVIAAAAAHLKADHAARALEIVSAFRAAGGRLFDTELLFGRILVGQDEFEAAIAHYQALEAQVPNSPQILQDLGAAYVSAGRHEAAIEAYRRAQEAGGDAALLATNLGEVLLLTGDREAAMDQLLTAHQLAPGDPHYMRNIAFAHLRAGAHDDALDWFQKAVDQAPNNLAAIKGLASAYTSLQRCDEAIEILTPAIESFAEDAELHHILGFALHVLHRDDEALQSCQRALDLDADFVATYATISDIYKARKLWPEALDTINSGLEIEPDNTMLLKVAFSLNRSFHRINEALQIGGRYLKHEPESIEVLADMIDTVLTGCRWANLEPFIAALVQAIDGRLQKNVSTGVCVNNLQALPLSYDYIVKVAANTSTCILADTAADRADNDFEVSAGRYAGAGRLRIGYLLPYVRFHSMPMAVKELVARHDRGVFEVFGYCVAYPDESEFAENFIAVFDKFSWSERRAELAQTIHDDEIAILIDCSGHTPKTCLDVCALRPAPLNLHLLGCNISSGAGFMDYLLSDRISIPPEQFEVGPDKMLNMPHSFMPAISSDISADGSSRRLEGLPEDAVVFCNFNQPFKIEPRIFETWMEILKGVPKSVLWLGDWNDAAGQNLRGHAAEQGVDPARLVFGRLIDHDRHLARLQHASLGLDTYYHGGGITTVDCLRAGLPVLCIRGETPSSRLGASILSAHGMTDLVADDFDAYRRLAIELALDAGRLAEIRTRCAANLDSAALFDFDGYVGDLEAGLRAIHDNFVAGRQPKHIDIRSVAGGQNE